MGVKNHQTFSNFSFLVFTRPEISTYVHRASWNEFMRTRTTISLELRDRNNKLTHGRCLKTTRVLVYRRLNTFFVHVPPHVGSNRAPWRNPISDDLTRRKGAYESA